MFETLALAGTASLRMRQCCPILVLTVWSFLSSSLVIATNLTFHVVEEQPPGTQVGSLPAESGVVYSFEQSYSKFSLNNRDIKTTSILDREKLAFNPITLIVKKTNSPKSHITVQVVVDDINDNSPKFPKSVYDIQISESVGYGVKFPLDSAKDKDAGRNGSVNYKIISGNSAGKFQLGTGNNCRHSPLCLIVIGDLDRESEEIYFLNISAQDGGALPRETFCLVKVSVKDSNDHSPQFLNLPYVGYVDENSNLSTSVLAVKASDLDTGVNAAITYSIEDDTENAFHIGAQNGVITTRGMFDYETKRLYTFQVVAKDSGSPPRENKSIVIVHVRDINEHAPVISVIYIIGGGNVLKPAVIPEGTVVNTRVAVVSVSDKDNLVNGKTNLKFLKGNELREFNISSISTKLFVITVSGHLDRETVPVYDLILEASDNGTPVKRTEYKLTVIVQDINDNAPFFSVPNITVSINEQKQIGSFVVSLNATDKDIGSNSKITYSFLSGNEYGWFTINPFFGLVTTAKLLDRENASHIALNIMAKDHGKPVLNGTVRVIVNIVDANDNPPVFRHSVYNKTIYENVTQGSTILQLSASDKDIGKNGEVTYAIESSSVDLDGLFTITSDSGILKTKVELDREVSSFYDIQIIAKDSGKPQLSARMTVHLTLEDVNDNDPRFYPLVYIASLLENEPAKELAQVMATDLDVGVNGMILYHIVTGNDNNHFSINKTSGIISSIKPLDHSFIGFYKLKVRASDGGGRTSQQLATVDITVLQNSDNLPVFQHNMYNFSVYENLPKGTVIGLVKATTKDLANVSYSIISGDPMGSFIVDQFGGIVAVDGAIDREIKSFYSLAIRAKVGTVKPLSSSCIVKVKVLDKNDVVPKFAVSSVEIKVDENWDIGTNIYQAIAVDNDLGVNGFVQYQLTAGKENFIINSTSGIISLAKKLSQNKHIYVLHVLATDGGLPPLYSSLVVKVIIETNHAPLFRSSAYATHIPANLPLGYRFYHVNAVDHDTGKNGKITYSLLAVGNEEGLFDIFPGGMMYVKKSLQLASQGSYIVTVVATDHGHPSLKATVPLTIFVVNSNEHRILFTNNTFRFTVSENKPPGSFVGHLTASAPNPSRTSEIDFLITSNSPNFRIDKISGVISTTKVIDREQVKSHTGQNELILQVEAFYNDTTLNKDRAIVIINISDENDNAPRFSEYLYHVSVNENVPPRSVIYRIIAHDPDEGTNGKFNFSITGGTGVGKFIITPQTGDLVLNDTIDRESLEFYNLTIKCTDMADISLFSSAVIQITVGDVNDNGPEFQEKAYVANVSEALAVGGEVISFSAVDSDIGTNAQIVYTVASGNLQGMFVINHVSGALTLSKKLDFESVRQYSLNITAEDRGIPRRTAVTQVEINVLDINDNPPVFNFEPMNISVPENITVGTLVGRCVATDKDSGENAKILYTLLSHEPVKNNFNIDQSTCSIRTSKELDYEEVSEFELKIQASDMAVPKSDRLTSTKLIKVMVQDINDNSPRFVSPPATAVLDGTGLGTTIMTLSAEDLDSGDNGDVSYQLLGEKGIFGLNLSSGALTLKSSLSKLLYEFSVQASDRGKPQQSSVQKITVFRRGTVGGGPTFSHSVYNTTLSENINVGSAVIHVSASDSGLKYFITKDNSGGSFDMNENSGVITTATEIDREGPRGVAFELDVYAVDTKGSVPKTSKVQVLVTILDQNDNVPTFSKPLYNLHVMENAVIGSNIGRVSATDPDLGDNGVIRFEISDGNEGNAFRIDQVTGYIYTREKLDRERMHVYYLNVTANDFGSIQKFSSSTVKIVVTDVNDNKPDFEKPFYTFNIFEDSKVGIAIGSVKALDSDEGINAQVSYYIIGEDRSTFSVGPSTGNLKLLRLVDHEKVPHYVLTLVAVDTDAPYFNSTVLVYVNILDKNDNPPRFVHKKYEVAVQEDVPLHTSIISVTAVDSDSGANGDIKYAISPLGGASVFKILSNGTVVNTKKLDREEKSAYWLEVLATDQAVPVSERLTGKTQLVINISDVNDNRPYFISSNVTHVSENARIGYPVSTLIVVDRDEGVNSKIVFSLRKVDSTAPFSLGKNSGILHVSGYLDREMKSKYIVYVTATDQGKPVLSAQMELQIFIVDYNDHAPVFQQHPGIVTVLENSTIGTSLLHFTATDKDEGENAEVQFSISTGNDYDVFEIDPKTGLLQTVKPLDYEQKAKYNLKIRASDQGIPEKFSFTSVSIVLQDVNDHAPIFNDSSYIAYVNESTTVHNFITVVATDKDKGIGGDVIYSIVHGGHAGLFTIGAKTGVMSLNSPLDREKKAEYKIRVRAQDGGMSSMFSEVEVIVKVQDENDNYPIVIPDKLQAIVVENSPENTFVIQVNATDKDEGNNAKLTYTLVNSYGRFRLDPSNGVLVTTVTLDREQVEIYHLQVKVTDKGIPQKEGSVSVNVIVGDENDHDPVFKQSSYKATVAAGAAPGSFITVTSAVDDDIGKNAQSEYSITAGATPVFSIGTTSGIITVSLTVPASPSTYSLTVTATNQNAPHQSTTAAVEIVVISQGSFPLFVHGDQELRISELVAVGTKLLSVNATGHLMYFIAAGNEGEVFSIDKVHGDISVAKPLDYELIRNYTLVIGAKDSSSPFRARYVIVHVFLMDENDNAPKFDKDVFYVTITEELYPPANVTPIHAADADSGINAKVEYRILESTPANGAFDIDRTSGWLYTRVKLDREKIAAYQLKVQADNVGKKSMKSEATVIITVADINDHAPVFENHEAVTVWENASIGSIVTTVSASDADEPKNAHIKYSVLPDPNQGGHFAINSDSGEITLDKGLNREKNDSFLLRILANDSVHETTMILKVEVMDINDNPPEFLEDPFIRNVAELLPVGTPILNITAQDRDIGLNAEISYLIVHSDDRFEINRKTGVISVTKVLKYRQPSTQVSPNLYNLTVEAMNIKSPFQTSNVSVIIQIVDINDHSPVFTKSSHYLVVVVPTPAGTSIMNVKAEDDKDFGENAVVQYMAVSGNGTQKFTIANDTGEIFVRSALHQSDKSSLFHLRVKAFDLGKPRQETFADVYIEVVDKNDHAPIFTNSGNIYMKTVSENLPVGGSVVKVTAVDNDSGTNGEVSYKVVGGNSAGFFAVGMKNGTIYAAKALDYEFGEEYELNVSAKDGGKISRSSFVRVKVTLTDSNDNAPVFTPHIYRPTLAENSKSGTYVCTLLATDRDGPGNNKVSFSLVGGDLRFFSIDVNTGIITSKAVFDYEDKKMYVLTASATDSGNPSLTSLQPAKIFIEITGKNEFVPRFTSKHYMAAVVENAPFGQSVTQVTAVDKDDGQDGIVAYYLLGSSNYQGFQLDRFTGVLSVSGKLDSETSKLVTLQVMAKNLLPSAASFNTSDLAEIVINVTDANDPPRFLRKEYQASVSEGAGNGAFVANVTAVDDDSEDSIINYGISSGDIQSVFHINPKTGIITTAAKLDRENTSVYHLTVTAQDTGQPPMTGTAIVIVSLIDVNDNPPYLASNCSGHILENSQSGSPVFILRPIDKDADPNRGPYTFAIEGTDYGKFVVDSNSGLISTTARLNREERASFVLSFRIYDNGSPKLSALSPCLIKVKDVNDNPPENKTRTVILNLYNGKFVGGTISNVQPIDKDTTNTMSCQLTSNVNRRFSFAKDSCILHSTQFDGQDVSFALQVTGHDGKASVVYEVIVKFLKYTQVTISSSIVVRLQNVHPSEFLEKFYKRFLNAIAGFLKPGYKPHLSSIRTSGRNSVDVLIGVHEENTDEYDDRGDVADLITKKKVQLEGSTRLSIKSIDYTPCSDHNPCKNGGECFSNIVPLGTESLVLSDSVIFQSANYEWKSGCRCKLGYGGERCEENVNDCKPNPCHNGGTCQDKISGYVCTCAPGFTDLHCLSDIDECSVNPCQSGGTCTNSFGSYSCSCREGYTGKNCETDINYCASNPCMFNSTCKDLQTTFECQCDFGGRGSKCQVPSLGFSPVSHMLLPTLQSLRRGTFNNITLEFATTSTRGLLLYNRDHSVNAVSPPDFLALENIDGKLRLLFNLGDGTVTVESEKFIADGKWHHVSVIRDKMVSHLFFLVL